MVYNRMLSNDVFEPNTRMSNISSDYYVSLNTNSNIQNDDMQKIDALINEIDEMLIN